MEIKSNLQTGLSPLDTAAATETRRTQEARAHAYGAGRVTENPAAGDRDQIHLSASAAVEIRRAQRLEALEAAVANGTYAPVAKEIASSLVDETISGSVDSK